jgi:purine-binding chemotaxis protein CheW
MNQPEYIRKTAPELRQEFDALFARAPQPKSGDFEDFLIIGLGGTAYAVRMTDTSGLFRNKKITPLPSPMPGLMGIAGFRGAVVPVYNLGVLMGRANATSEWLFLTRSNVAFAFDELDAYTRISHDAIFPASASIHGEAPGAHVGEAVRIDGTIRPIANLASILASIRAQLRPGVSKKE